MNTLKIGILLTGLTLILIFIGRMVGGNQGMIIAFGIALLMNGLSYWFSDKLILSMYHAKEVSEHTAPVLYRIIGRLTQKANLPFPKIYVIPGLSPNAFATGRDPHHAAVAVTEGIIGILNEDELEGVLSHELSHIKNRDILIGSIAATIAGAITILADMARFAAIFNPYTRRDRNHGAELLIMAIVAPIAALLIQMMISRSREYLADEAGGRMSGQPLALASALKKLEASSRRGMMQVSPATAHLFIVNPLSAEGLLTLFSTHPPIRERVARLERLAQVI